MAYNWVLEHQGNGVWAVVEDRGGAFERVSTGSKEQCQLVAAAPELLAALEMLLKETLGSVGKFKPELYRHCKEILNTAKGK